MKKVALEFLRRGVMSCGVGPIILAVLYLILHHNGVVENVSVKELCVGIFSLTALAFVAGGINAIYQLERLPLMAAILIHGSVLYVSYLMTYLVNGWLEWGRVPVLVFTGIFVVGYLVIWAVIYFVIKRKTKNLNKMLKEKQQSSTLFQDF
ncbi:MAG: DUF3021 domain-containing protein [Clostridia bacterium]|nr:DUF3021 domain-containing protein [Clostridia bacterium]